MKMAEHVIVPPNSNGSLGTLVYWCHGSWWNSSWSPPAWVPKTWSEN